MEEACKVIQFNFCAEGIATGCMSFGAGLASGVEPLLPWYPSWHCLSMARYCAG